MLPIDKFYNIIDEVATIVNDMHRGARYVELSTYFRNRVPGITDAEISAICDVLYPMQRKIQENL